MRTPELVTEYERGTDNSKEIFTQLEQAGYRYLGGGQDATVWGRDEGEVLKVLMPAVNKAAAEASFIQFFDMCTSLKRNPHVPKFFGGHEAFSINGVDYIQITMESLTEIQSSSTQEAIVWALSDLCTDLSVNWKTVIAQISDPEFWRLYPGKRNDPAFINQVVSDARHYKKLFATMQFFYQHGTKLGLGWDLHTENAMQRNDGTIVITDPYFTS